jgi:hypothetical protein
MRIAAAARPPARRVSKDFPSRASIRWKSTAPPVPENDADQPAGSINMKTKRAFDRKGRAVTYNYSLNFNGEEFSLKKQPGIQDGRDNWKSEKWLPNWNFSYAESFFNQRFGLLLSAGHGASYTEQLSQTIDYNRAPQANDPPPARRPLGQFRRRPKVHHQRRAPPDGRLQGHATPHALAQPLIQLLRGPFLEPQLRLQRRQQ